MQYFFVSAGVLRLTVLTPSFLLATYHRLRGYPILFISNCNLENGLPNRYLVATLTLKPCYPIGIIDVQIEKSATQFENWVNIDNKLEAMPQCLCTKGLMTQFLSVLTCGTFPNKQNVHVIIPT